MRTDIPEGAEVVVTKDDGSEVYTKTRSKPWRLGHGAWVVLLDGVSGGYDLKRVRLAPTQGGPSE